MGIFRLYANLGIGNDADIDIKSLPEAIRRGIFKPISLIKGAAASFVTFDLVTTDLSKIEFCIFFTQILFSKFFDLISFL